MSCTGSGGEWVSCAEWVSCTGSGGEWVSCTGTVLGTGCPVLEELTLEAALVIGNNFPDQAYRIRLQGAVYDPRRINNTTGNLNNSSAQRERKKCQVESICYESSDVAALSTLPDTA